MTANDTRPVGGVAAPPLLTPPASTGYLAGTPTVRPTGKMTADRTWTWTYLPGWVQDDPAVGIVGTITGPGATGASRVVTGWVLAWSDEMYPAPAPVPVPPAAPTPTATLARGGARPVPRSAPARTHHLPTRTAMVLAMRRPRLDLEGHPDRVSALLAGVGCTAGGPNDPLRDWRTGCTDVLADDARNTLRVALVKVAWTIPTRADLAAAYLPRPGGLHGRSRVRRAAALSTVRRVNDIRRTGEGGTVRKGGMIPFPLDSTHLEPHCTPRMPLLDLAGNVRTVPTVKGGLMRRNLSTGRSGLLPARKRQVVYGVEMLEPKRGADGMARSTWRQVTHPDTALRSKTLRALGKAGHPDWPVRGQSGGFESPVPLREMPTGKGGKGTIPGGRVRTTAGTRTGTWQVHPAAPTWPDHGYGVPRKVAGKVFRSRADLAGAVLPRYSTGGGSVTWTTRGGLPVDSATAPTRRQVDGARHATAVRLADHPAPPTPAPRTVPAMVRQVVKRPTVRTVTTPGAVKVARCPGCHLALPVAAPTCPICD